MFVCRWASFRLMFDDIDSNIRKLLERAQDVKYHEHIGGDDEQDPKPTKKGVALRLEEWAKMRNIVETIDDNHPSLASTIPCYLQEDHQNQMGALECRCCSAVRHRQS